MPDIIIPEMTPHEALTNILLRKLIELQGGSSGGSSQCCEDSLQELIKIREANSNTNNETTKNLIDIFWQPGENHPDRLELLKLDVTGRLDDLLSFISQDINNNIAGILNYMQGDIANMLTGIIDNTTNLFNSQQWKNKVSQTVAVEVSLLEGEKYHSAFNRWKATAPQNAHIVQVDYVENNVYIIYSTNPS